MNANARATTDHSSFRKPAFKSPWPTKPTKPVKQSVRGEVIVCGLMRPGPFAAQRPKNSSTRMQRLKPSSHSLRDSISAALRRSPDTAFDVDNRAAEDRNTTIIPNSPIPSDSNISETGVSFISLGSNRFDDHSPRTPTTYQDHGAYIPEPEIATAQNLPTILPQAHNAVTHPPGLSVQYF
ncbi:hypothetical protein FS749_004782 [Ceratobasidium sp. UAMH 11750]|nr:hypothetical protein FS749_004782 [Ceratobasidium sp. UAMH 11750]